jgi:WD40 repeat protein
LIGLEIVVEERSADAGTFLSVPWNLVYDERPAKYKAAFQKGEGVERWRPFWSVRYNLTSGRRVEPLKRLPLWSDPRVVIVVDPTVHEDLNDDQKGRLDSFLAEAGLSAVGSMDELEAALEEGYPRLLYWLGHATPEYLQLGDERIAPGDLRNLLRSFDDRDRPEGMLAFLNGCQTAEAGSGGSFLDVLHSFGFTGAIATERQTIDTFANEFGLSFLRGFLREGRPLGELLHELRLKSAPLGLLYGAHCPPEIRVRSGNGAADIPAPLPIHESGPVSGVPLGVATLPALGNGATASERIWTTPRPSAIVPPLPDEPYRSLGYYDEADRALFTGRDADVVRFAATLDRPDTRILILHGESGIGKSSFLRAGVIPYLEQECVGYRFLRRSDGSLRIIQPAKDLLGVAAQHMLDATAAPVCYRTPEGGQETVNLRPLIDKAIGKPADLATLREALRRDSGVFAEILSHLADRLPYALVLVFDQIEEVFTLAKTPAEVADRDHALQMLCRVVDLRADAKLIISLRTEYYGRLLDHLRAVRRELTGVRDELLRDFSRSTLIEAITRPTSEAKYGFRYADGVAEAVADGVLAMRSENQDSVLPLVQVICAQLYERKKAQAGSEGVITREDLDAIKGVEGGLKAFAEDALVGSLHLGPEDREAFKGLFSQLYSRQPDGTLTTWLMPREDLQRQWDRPTPFADLLDAARTVRLLREDELRIEGDEPRRYIRLGHDALAKVAAAWKSESVQRERITQERRRRRRLIGLLAGASLLAALFAIGGLAVWRQKDTLNSTLSQLKEEHQAQVKATNDALDAEKTAMTARRDAEQKRQEAEVTLYASRLGEANKEIEDGDMDLAREVLEKCPVGERGWEWAHLRLSCQLELLKIKSANMLGVAFSPDDRYLATAANERGLLVFDSASGRLVLQGMGHTATAFGVAYSPDGKRIATSSWDQTVRLWDATTGTPLRVFRDHKARVLAVAFSPDGRHVVSGDEGGQVLVWDPETGKLVLEFLRHPGWVDGVAFSPDGRRIASVGAPKTVLVWDAVTGKQELSLEGHTAPARRVAFSPDGHTIATTGMDGAVILWDATSGKPSKKLFGHTGEIVALAYSPDGRHAATGGFDRTVRVWSTERGTTVLVLRGHADPVVALAYSHDGRRIASGSFDGSARIWDARHAARKFFGYGRDCATCVAYCLDGRRLVSSSADGRVHVWDTDSNQELASVAAHEGKANAVAYSPDQLRIASGGDDGLVKIWASDGLTLASVFRTDSGGVNDLAFCPDGRQLASCGDDGMIRLWDLSAGKEAAAFAGHRGAVRGLAYSPDGRLIGSAGEDGTVRLWDVSVGKELHKLEGHTDWVYRVAFSPDGRRLASASEDGRIKLWDVAAGTEVPTFNWPPTSTHALAFTADGRRLALAGFDPDIRILDLATGQVIFKLRGHSDFVRCLAFSPDGRCLASASDDRSVRIWETRPQSNPTGSGEVTR